jgi:hypothetical protein
MEFKVPTSFLARGQLEFDLGQLFMAYVHQWLIDTDNKTGQWVKAVSILYDYLD